MRRLMLLIFLLGATPAFACTASFPNGAKRAIGSSPNQATFSAALSAAVNEVRCKQRRAAMSADARLNKAAVAHSRNMERTDTFSHRTRVSGQQTLRQRIRGSGVSYRRGAENIALKSACNRGRYSYATLARAVVAQWMGSSGHRKNLLNGAMRRVGSGVAFDRANGCGQYYVTLVLTD